MHLRAILQTVLALAVVTTPIMAQQGFDDHGEADPGAERARGFGLPRDDEGIREGMWPFVIPWDGSGGQADVSFLNHTPAGRFGRVEARGEDLFAGDEQVRFFAVNLILSAAVPEHDVAEKVAARLASLGVNLVRFHHIDNHHALLTDPNTSRPIDAERLDRLDYIIAQLKRRGIYTNLNLLVTRRFKPGDGLPGEIRQVQGKMQHLLGFWHEPSFALHAEYARTLIGHRNPYTKLTYAKDPAVAFVEIINENGLANTWLDANRRPRLEELPEVFAKSLRDRWNTWLAGKHGNVAAAVEVPFRAHHPGAVASDLAAIPAVVPAAADRRDRRHPVDRDGSVEGVASVAATPTDALGQQAVGAESPRGHFAFIGCRGRAAAGAPSAMAAQAGSDDGPVAVLALSAVARFAQDHHGRRAVRHDPPEARQVEGQALS